MTHAGRHVKETLSFLVAASQSGAASASGVPIPALLAAAFDVVPAWLLLALTAAPAAAVPALIGAVVRGVSAAGTVDPVAPLGVLGLPARPVGAAPSTSPVPAAAGATVLGVEADSCAPLV